MSEQPEKKTRKKASPKSPTSSSTKKKSPPTEEAIRMRAYEIYLERGCTPGDPEEDWLLAERQLISG